MTSTSSRPDRRRDISASSRSTWARRSIIEKSPLRGPLRGTDLDEAEMGVRYADMDGVVKGREVDAEARARIEKMHASTEHKRRMPSRYGE